MNILKSYKSLNSLTELILYSLDNFKFVMIFLQESL